MGLNGQNAIITGGANGIGLEIVIALLQEGVNCAILDCNDSKGKTVKDTLCSEYGAGRVVFEKCDVSDQAGFEEAVGRAMATFKRLDIFINNAGVGDEDQWEMAVKINMGGVIKGSQLGMKHMSVESGGVGGVILNVSSILGLAPRFWPVYSATKSGIIGYTRCIADPETFSKTGVRALVLCPGATDTCMIRKSIQENERVRNLLAVTGTQEASHVGKCVIEILKTAKNGTVWISDGGKPAKEYIFPPAEP